MLKEIKSSHGNSIRVLFLGRANCNYSVEGLQLLESLNFKVYYIISDERGQNLPTDLKDYSFDYIFSFRSFFILDKQLILSCKNYSINFHPGPPDYPGSGCVNIAIYNKEKRFGVTCHLMDEIIDSGSIVDVNFFSISSEDDVAKVLKTTHRKLYQMFCKIVKKIDEKGNAFIENQLDKNKLKRWSGKRRGIKYIDKMSKIDKGISKDELDLRIKSFHTEEYPISLNVHGKIFFYKSSDK